ncbi:MAG: hypothetical protein V3T84_06295 [Phycisphaerales bacterium]
MDPDDATFRRGPLREVRGIAWHNDSLFISTMREVFNLFDDKLGPVDFGSDRPTSCFALSAADGVLWSIGAKDVISFDGEEWSRID